MDLSLMRREYMHAGLARQDLQANPLDQFADWFATAESNQLDIANAMTLATVDAQGMPSLRTVLLLSLIHI